MIGVAVRVELVLDPQIGCDGGGTDAIYKGKCVVLYTSQVLNQIHEVGRSADMVPEEPLPQAPRQATDSALKRGARSNGIA